MAAAVIAVATAAGVALSRRTTTPPTLAVVRLVSPTGGSATGTAVIHAESTGLRVDLTVRDLPDTAPGHFHTCWMVGPGDTLAHPNRVSVGSFTVHGPAAAHLDWDTAADLARFPTVGVTTEPDNGNPAHQGPKILASV